jgi:ankyrin repeat protein
MQFACEAMMKFRWSFIIPKGLVATYERFLFDIPTEYQDIAKQLLHFIAGSRRLLSLDEIRVLLALQNPHKNLAAVAANSQLNICATIEAILGGLVRILDGYVSFIHLSAKNFLTDLSKQLDHPLSTLYGISEVMSDKVLAKSCISYLLLDDFKQDMFGEDNQATKYLPTSPIPRTSEDEGLFSFWGGLNLGEDTIFKDLSEADWNSCNLIAARNPLFDYAALHWASHFQSCSTLCSSELWQSAVKLSNNSSPRYSNWFRYYWLHCEVDLALPNNFTTFITGCFFGHLATVKIMAKIKPALDRDTISHGLYWASWKGHDILISHLLQLGAMPNWKMANHQSPLIVAACFGHLNVLSQLLEVNEVEVNDCGKAGRTALSMAAGNGHSAIVKYLLHHKGIQPNIPDFSQWTPIFWALGSKYKEIVHMLALDGRIDLNHVDKAGRSVLSWAAAAGETEIIKFLLLRKKINVQERDFRGRTAFSWAAENGCLDTVMALRRSQRINLREKDNDGRNAISWAAANGHHAVLQYLIKHNPSGAVEGDKSGWAPLAWALNRDSADTVKALLESGLVDPNRRDKSGRTILSWAEGYGYQEVIRLIADATKPSME